MVPCCPQVIARGVGPAGKLAHMPPAPRPAATNNKQIHTGSGYQVKYSQPLPGEQNNGNQKYDPAVAASQTNSYSKTNSKPPTPSAPSKTNAYPPSPLQREKSKTRERDNGKTGRPKDVQISQKYDAEDAPPPPRRTTERPTTTTASDKFTSDEQQKHVDVSDSDDNDDIELVKLQEQDDGFGNDDQQAQLREAPVHTTSSPPTSLNLKKEDVRNEVEDDFDNENDDFAIVKPFPGTTTSADNTCSASCTASCMPSTRSINGDMDAMTVREFAARIKADAIFDVLPEIEDQLQNVLDFATSGYTMFLPSNDAVARLPKSLIKR